jgi:outer membrane receptor protein involved in Fe transport
VPPSSGSPVASEAHGEVVVRDTAAPNAAVVPHAVVVLQVDERLAASSDVAAVVESAVGAHIERAGGPGAYAAVTLRGSTTDQVQVHIDGVPLNPDGDGTVSLSELPLHAFERVEVYRGGAPAALGAAPIGGVVNLVTGGRAQRRGRFSMTTGSFGTTRVAASGTGTSGLVAVDVLRSSGEYTFFDDNGTGSNRLDDHLRRRENAEVAQGALHARARWGDRGLRLTVLDSAFARQAGLPGHANNPAEHARLETARNLAVVQLDAQSGGTVGVARAWWRVRDQVLDDRASELGVGRSHTGSLANTLGLHTHGAVTAGAATVGLTATARRDRWVGRDQELAHTEAPRTRLAGSVVADAGLWLADERVHLAPVLHGTWLDDRGVSDTAALRRVDPRLGLLIRPAPGISVRAQAGSYLRPPDLMELFGDQGGSVGNPDLRPERGWQADGGVITRAAGEVSSLAVELGAFTGRATDRIVYVQNAQRTLVPLNVGASTVRGVELSVVAATGDWVEVDLAAAGTVTENLGPAPLVVGRELPRIPKWSAHNRTAVMQGPIRLSHTLRFVDGFAWDAANWYRAPPRTAHDVFARLSVPSWPALELGVANLTNRIVEAVPRDPLHPESSEPVVRAITDLAGYPLPGRAVFFTLTWEGT